MRLPPNVDEMGTELVWEDGEGPYYMVLNLTADDVQMLEAGIVEKCLNTSGADYVPYRNLRETLRNGLVIQHLDEFRAAATEPLDPYEDDDNFGGGPVMG